VVRPLALFSAYDNSTLRVRTTHGVIQYKMILKQSLIPMRDDPENERIGVDKPLGNAHHNAACRESYQFANQRVLEGQAHIHYPYSWFALGFQKQPQ
jgi:hypothetical protein